MESDEIVDRSERRIVTIQIFFTEVPANVFAFPRGLWGEDMQDMVCSAKRVSALKADLKLVVLVAIHQPTKVFAT